MSALLFGQHPAFEVKVGDVFYNPERGNCLRVTHVWPTMVNCLSWRPNGEKGSKPQNVKIESLRRYQRVEFIRVVTDSADLCVYFRDESAPARRPA